jgi:hypothetical protein
MHITHRRSGWRFQIRVPREIEFTFGNSPIRLNLGRITKRRAVRMSRLLAGRAESVFMNCRNGVDMTNTARDDLVEELQELLLAVMETSEEALETADRRRRLEVGHTESPDGAV